MSGKASTTEHKQTFINELYQNSIKSCKILAFLLLLKAKLHLNKGLFKFLPDLLNVSAK